MARKIARERVLSFPAVQRRLEEVRWGTPAEAAGVLREVLEAPPGPDGDSVDFRLWEAAMIAWSLLTGGDRTENPPEQALAEIADDGRLSDGLKDLLRRLVDRQATDRVESVADALRLLEPVAAEIEQREREKPKPAATTASTTPAPLTGSRRRLALLGFFAIPALLVLLLVYKVASTGEQLADPTPTSSVSGTTVDVIPKDRFDRNRPSWASEASASSNGEYSDRLIGWPDVFPRTAHANNAWYPYRPDRGTEWVQVNWSTAWETEEIVVVETFNPGAIVAVDDVADFLENKLGANDFVRLWSGTTPAASESRALVFRLATPRRIAALRIVLDTARVPGLNEIDAIGIVAPRASP